MKKFIATAPWCWRFAILKRTQGDDTYLQNEGVQVAVAVARFWAQRVHWSAHRGRPMSCWVSRDPTSTRTTSTTIGTPTTWRRGACVTPLIWSTVLSAEVSSEECEDLETNCQGMCLPQQEGTLIRLQQDGFLDKDLKPASSCQNEERPINQVWSWDRILRSCFIKQADVLQGFYFFPDDFSRRGASKANFDFYEPMTVHESSLSPCVHSILAAKLGTRRQGA